MKDVPSAQSRNKAVSDALPMLDEILDLAPTLEAGWRTELAAIPPGTLVNRAEPEPEPGEEEPSGEPEGEPTGDEESFIDSFDLDSVPREARSQVEALQREWQGNYTKRRQADRQEVEEARREAEELRALAEGISNPNTLPHYLRLLGVDPTDPDVLAALGIAPGGGQDPELDLLLDEPDPLDSLKQQVGQLQQERATERQEREAAQVEQALDDLADQELERIEGDWGRKLDDDEDAFIRHRAEAAPGRDGLPDYESAAKVLKGWLARREQDWAKRRSEPGRGAPGGKPGGKALDAKTEEGRLALAAAAAERAMASQT